MARRIGGFLERLPKGIVVIVSYVLLLIVAWVDYTATPLRLTLLIYYLIPIFGAAWFGGPVQGLIIAFLASVLNLGIDLHYLNLYPHPVWPVLNDIAAFALYIMSARVISLMRALIETEQALARTDSITGAANRRAFFEMLDYELNRARRTGEPLTLVYLDLDDFKLVNDRWGHTTGDAVLRLTVTTLAKHTRATDLVARLGGDEFALFLPAPTGNVQTAIERIQTELVAAMTTHNWPVTFSIGAVTFTQAPESVDVMLKEADSLMYTAKGSGKNRLEYKRIP